MQAWIKKISKIDKPLANLINKKGEDSNIENKK
jgi:hypothetical protein